MGSITQTKHVVFYRDEKGNVPVKEWLYGLKNKQARRRIIRRLRYIEQGNYGDFKKLVRQKGLLELRFSFGPGFRLYIAEVEKSLIVLLVGGHKKTQSKDILRAAEYLSDYRENRRNETLSNT